MKKYMDDERIRSLRGKERVRELRRILLICANLLSPSLYAAFWIADYFYAPEHFLLFGCLRLLTLLPCLLLNVVIRRTRSIARMQLFGALYVFVCALVITIMAFLAEGKTSVYYAGLNLLTIAVGSFIPWDSGALICNVSLIYIPYLIWSWITWSAGGHAIFLVNCFFMGTTIILTLVIRSFNESYRMAALRSRVALCNELDKRAAIIQKKTAEALQLEEQFRQAQKLEAIGRLAGGVAHDFNNILMIIQSYAEIVHDDLPDESNLREKTDCILTAAKRAAGLTRQMLAFGRKQILSPVVLDLNAVIDETAKMLKRVIGEHIEFRVSPSPRLWATEADPSQITQVVMNLCVNARDAMPNGGLLTIATENIAIRDSASDGCPDAPPGDYVTISVADTGIGISKSMQETIFEPFFTTKEVGKGTGLGLATVYGIVKQSGGYVSVHSELGKGACFRIYLPRVKQTSAAEACFAEDPRPKGRETILVTEDEEGVREALCAYLRQLGYNVLEAHSGAHALEIAAGRNDSIDLLVTDVVMPKMCGRELSDMLTRLRPELRTIFISGYTDDSVLRHDIQNLGATLLQKPFGLDVLAREVHRVLVEERQCDPTCP